ncbi:MAG TPA: alpha/beta fold hydrolase [Gemmatimonadaceae bacterium]|nr:alpha/beta fold hydrolase [Gemmatimonadaceae bacterium]
MNNHEKILGAAAILFLAGCATRSAAPTDAVVPGAVVVTSAAPLAMTQEPVTLKTATGEISGTLVLPAAGTPVPVVLIIAGSGPTDRNGNSPAIPGANNSLRMLAEGLAARGIASVRYDKRGIAASRAAMTGEADLRFTHFIEDAAAWVKQLREDQRFSTVTIVGHSEGSLIGMVAARGAGADAYVSLEGTGRKAADILAEQLKPQLPPELFAQTQAILDQLSSGTIPNPPPTVLPMLFRPSVLPYLVSWFSYDPAVEIAKLEIPILVVQGTTDIQTSMEDAKLLASANSDARFVTIEGMNHILKEVSGDRVAQMPKYGDSTLAVVPKLMDEIAVFVKSISKRAARDSWSGPDKIKHFFISAFIESLAFSGLQATGAGRNTAFAGAIATTAAFALARELYDKRTKGIFSIPDLTWDAAGAGAAALILRSTQH